MCSTRVSQLTDKNDYRMNTGFQNYTETVEKIFFSFKICDDNIWKSLLERFFCYFFCKLSRSVRNNLCLNIKSQICPIHSNFFPTDGIHIYLYIHKKSRNLIKNIN